MKTGIICSFVIISFLLNGCMNRQTVTVRDLSSWNICNRAVVHGASGSDTRYWNPAPEWAHYVTEAKRRGITCGTDNQVDLTFKRGLSKYSIYEICKEATFTRSDGSKQFLGTSNRFVAEAKRRNLQCGTASKSQGSKTLERKSDLAHRTDEWLCNKTLQRDGTYKKAGPYGLEIQARGLSCPQIHKITHGHIKNSEFPPAVALNDKVLCDMATNNVPNKDRWSYDPKYEQYVQEAQTRKLSCWPRQSNEKRRDSDSAEGDVVAYPSYDPAGVSWYYCTNNNGFLGNSFGGSSRCIESIKLSCDQAYPKRSGDPVSYANNLTCQIKSGDGEFAKVDDWNFGRAYLAKRRAYYVMAVQNLMSFGDAHQSAELVSQVFNLEYERFWAAKQRQNMNMILMGSCFATHGIQNCLAGGGSYERQPNGFLASSTLSGWNRICSYDVGASRQTVTVNASRLCPLSLNKAKTMQSRPRSGIAILQNFYVNGLNKDCVYSDGLSGFVMTVGADKTCPLRP